MQFMNFDFSNSTIDKDTKNSICDSINDILNRSDITTTFINKIYFFDKYDCNGQVILDDAMDKVNILFNIGNNDYALASFIHELGHVKHWTYLIKHSNPSINILTYMPINPDNVSSLITKIHIVKLKLISECIAEMYLTAFPSNTMIERDPYTYEDCIERKILTYYIASNLSIYNQVDNNTIQYFRKLNPDITVESIKKVQHQLNIIYAVIEQDGDAETLIQAYDELIPLLDIFPIDDLIKELNKLKS